MHKGVIVLKKAGQTIPEAYLKMVLKENTTCMGGALATKDDDGRPAIELAKDTMDKEGTLENIMSVQTQWKDKDFIYYFGNYPDGFQKDDLQPFELLKDVDDRLILIGFLEGDFAPFAKAGSSHSSEFFVANELLVPALKKIYQNVKGDERLLLKELADPVVRTQLINTSVDRGAITLLAVNGEVMTYNKNKLSSDFPWGWTSNTYGYTEKAPEVKKNIFGKIKDAITPAVKEAPVASPIVEVPGVDDTEVPGVAVPDVAVPEKKVEIKVEAKKETKEVLMRCPADIHGKSRIKDWYRKSVGFIPTNWKERPEVPVKILKDFKDLPKDLPIPVKTVPTVPAAEPKKEDTKQPVGETEPLPVVSAESIKVVAEIVKKAGPPITSEFDPSTIQGLESKWPTFTQQCKEKGIKINLEDTFRWSYKSLLALCMGNEAAAGLILEYRAAYIGKLKEDERPAVITQPIVNKEEDDAEEYQAAAI